MGAAKIADSRRGRYGDREGRKLQRPDTTTKTHTSAAAFNNPGNPAKIATLVRSGLDQLREKRLYCFFPHTCCLKPSQGQDAGAKRPQHLLPIPDQQRHRSNGNPAQLPVRPRRTTFQVHPDQNGTKTWTEYTVEGRSRQRNQTHKLNFATASQTSCF